MLITKIREGVNQALAGERLSMVELIPHLDYTIDQINQNMNTQFPVFSELAADATEYNAFPDIYIRTVVIPGAAWHYYVYDEEGIPTANQYSSIYETGKFNMLRDYTQYVPEEYQLASTGYTVSDATNRNFGDRGIEVDGSNFFI